MLCPLTSAARDRFLASANEIVHDNKIEPVSILQVLHYLLELKPFPTRERDRQIFPQVIITCISIAVK